MCVWYVCICTHVWKPEVSFECLFELFSELHFETESLTELETIGLVRLAAQ